MAGTAETTEIVWREFQGGQVLRAQNWEGAPPTLPEKWSYTIICDEKGKWNLFSIHWPDGPVAIGGFYSKSDAIRAAVGDADAATNAGQSGCET